MRKEYEVVLDALPEALILSEISGDVLLRSSVLSLMALAHLERGDFEPTFEAAQQALEQAQSGSERLDQMRARVIFTRAELGVSTAEGRVRTATEALEGVLKEALLTGSSAVEVFALEHLVVVLRDSEQLGRALECALGHLAQRLSTNRPEAQATNACKTPLLLLVLLENG